MNKITYTPGESYIIIRDTFRTQTIEIENIYTVRVRLSCFQSKASLEINSTIMHMLTVDNDQLYEFIKALNTHNPNLCFLKMSPKTSIKA